MFSLKTVIKTFSRKLNLTSGSVDLWMSTGAKKRKNLAKGSFYQKMYWNFFYSFLNTKPFIFS